MIPDKIYVREYPDGLNQFWDRKKRDDVVATIYHEYIRKDALLGWLDGKLTIEGATEGYVGGYDSALKDVIDKLNKV